MPPTDVPCARTVAGQNPDWQESVRHEWLQPPQLLESVAGSKQVEPQRIWVPGHVHTPWAHVVTAGQACVQPPQLAGSVFVSTQTEAHIAWPGAVQFAGLPESKSVSSPGGVTSLPASSPVTVGAAAGSLLLQLAAHVTARPTVAATVKPRLLSDFKNAPFGEIGPFGCRANFWEGAVPA
jgi:hypothetical protein